jgi:hypothetical protein
VLRRRSVLCPPQVAAGIVEKWWRQHMIDFDGDASRVPSLEIRGENLDLTRVGYTWQ